MPPCAGPVPGVAAISLQAPFTASYTNLLWLPAAGWPTHSAYSLPAGVKTTWLALVAGTPGGQGAGGTGIGVVESCHRRPRSLLMSVSPSSNVAELVEPRIRIETTGRAVRRTWRQTRPPSTVSEMPCFVPASPSRAVKNAMAFGAVAVGVATSASAAVAAAIRMGGPYGAGVRTV